MSSDKHRYYLFSLANFIAAIGGGMILGKGVAAIDIPALHGSSILAFFVGTVVGLGFLQFTPERFSKIFARWFSLMGGMTSLILFGIFVAYSTNEKISGSIAVIFFILLSVRFGFWFYSRVLRVATTAGQQQNIAWVEMGYYSGVIVGLILWKFLGIEITMAAALLIDSFFQICAGMLDLYVQRTEQITTASQNNNNNPKPIETHHTTIWLWRLAFAVIFLTIGVQVIIFNLAHQVSDDFSPYVLAIFYLGAAISAFLCKQFNIQLDWPSSVKNKAGYASIFYGSNNKNFSFLLGSILSAMSVAIVILNVIYWQSNTWLLTFVFCSTFFYSILELAILDRIGLEKKNSPQRGMVLRTYGMMSVAAVLSLWILEMTQSSLIGLSITLGFCFILTIWTVRKRATV